MEIKAIKDVMPEYRLMNTLFFVYVYIRINEKNTFCNKMKHE